MTVEEAWLWLLQDAATGSDVEDAARALAMAVFGEYGSFASTPAGLSRVRVAFRERIAKLGGEHEG